LFSSLQHRHHFLWPLLSIVIIKHKAIKQSSCVVCNVTSFLPERMLSPNCILVDCMNYGQEKTNYYYNKILCGEDVFTSNSLNRHIPYICFFVHTVHKHLQYLISRQTICQVFFTPTDLETLLFSYMFIISWSCFLK
jgi:hypothetical protein